MFSWGCRTLTRDEVRDTTDNKERPYGDNPAITPIGPNSGHYGQPGPSHEFDSAFHIRERPLGRDEMKENCGHNTHSESNRRPVAGVRPSARADQYQGGRPGKFKSIYDHALNIRLEVPFSSSPPGEMDCPDLVQSTLSTIHLRISAAGRLAANFGLAARYFPTMLIKHETRFSPWFACGR